MPPNYHDLKIVFNREFLLTIGQELSTPVDTIVSIADLLDSKEDVAENYLRESLKSSVDKLLVVTHEIVDFAQLLKGELRLEPRSINLRKALLEVIDIQKAHCQARGLIFEYSIDGSLNELYEVDINRLLQIVKNLLNNIERIIPKGYVKFGIDVKASDKEYDLICISIEESGNYIQSSQHAKTLNNLSYMQTVNIAKQDAPFFLGLAITQELLYLFQSKIEVDVLPGKGTRFYFDLKLRKSGLDIQEICDGSNSLANKSCLLAEHNDLNAVIAQTILNRWGIHVELACNGLEAVAKSHKKRYDFILMDINMSEMNGFDVIQMIRKQVNLNQRTPVFALTSCLSANDAVRYGGYFTDFLMKPLDVNKLHKALIASTKCIVTRLG